MTLDDEQEKIAREKLAKSGSDKKEEKKASQTKATKKVAKSKSEEKISKADLEKQKRLEAIKAERASRAVDKAKVSDSTLLGSNVDLLDKDAIKQDIEEKQNTTGKDFAIIMNTTLWVIIHDWGMMTVFFIEMFMMLMDGF